MFIEFTKISYVFFSFRTPKTFTMVLLEQYVRIFEDDTYIESYLKKKETDCILYSNNGVEFNIHKEVLYQTKFMQSLLLSTHDICCTTTEIICPCSESELDCMVNFLYR